MGLFRFAAAVLLAAVFLASPAGAQHAGPTRDVAAGRAPSMTSTRPGVALVDLGASAYPVPDDLMVPGTTEPFFQSDDRGRYHLAPRGGKLYVHPTYDDRRSLLVEPPHLGRSPPRALVVFFHGNLATLERDVVGRQRVAAQFARSGLEAAMVAPQLAVDALDSSPGRFYERGFLDSYLSAAAQGLAARSGGRLAAADIDALPVILVAYSGGYLATAYSLPVQSGTHRRIAGVILLDALFGEEQKFADWLSTRPSAFFVSAYSASSAPLNRKLADDLARSGTTPLTNLPHVLQAGDIAFLPALTAVHNDFVTNAWTRDPLTAVLRRVDLGPR